AWADALGPAKNKDRDQYGEQRLGGDERRDDRDSTAVERRVQTRVADSVDEPGEHERTGRAPNALDGVRAQGDDEKDHDRCGDERSRRGDEPRNVIAPGGPANK